jgi:DNA topoisomerase-1
MAEKALVIVESPTKARTIKRFLPKAFTVEASIGHVRDLPQKASDVPAKYKDTDWGRLGINVENDFEPLYITPKDKKKILKELSQKIKEADAVYLATDEDREGESISWHLIETLNPKVPVRRMVFHEITKAAIEHSLEDTRDIDMRLVKAQETRRILDRLYGYTISPLIWKKIAYGLSAGRVQSPGLRLIVQRERERIQFKQTAYWDLKAQLISPKDKNQVPFEARLQSIEGKRIASGKDFDSTTGEFSGKKDVRILGEEEAAQLVEKLQELPWSVKEVTEKETTSRPAAPFITSTLQQEGNRKLGLSARETMRTAQRLYEEGLITYMRTDSPQLSSEAIGGARRSVEELYGKEYLSETPRQYTPKSQSAQEAHEAIRPAGPEFTHPDETKLDGREKRVYEMIWKRTMATQMAEAKKLSVTAKIAVDECIFNASGTRILFPGFLRVYVEGKDDPEAALDDKEELLPDLNEGQAVTLSELAPDYHETRPPARYTEASLVQALEREGIGRPSTYASIISTLYERDYTRKQGNALVPTFTGIAVVQLLENYFQHLIDYGFTSDMEDALDEIAAGNRDYLQYLKEFYFGEEGLLEQVRTREEQINPDKSRKIELPHIDGETEIRIGRYGPYIVHQNSTEEVHASIPEDVAPADLTEEEVEELIEVQKNVEPLGQDPETGLNVYCLVGRYGPYVQLGEQTEERKKPKRASVPRDMKPKDVDLPFALKLLSLPRTLGQHPETGKDVVASNGRFGPYVVHDGDFRSLRKGDDVYTIDLNRALEILAQEKKGGRRSKVLKDLGSDPEGNKKVAVYDGKYGPYIKYGSKNISLPDDKQDKETIENLSLEEAMGIVKNSSKVKSK